MDRHAPRRAEQIEEAVAFAQASLAPLRGVANNKQCVLRRAGQIEEAVAFAQASLAPLRGLLSHRNRAYDAMLHDVIALLAYEQPLVRIICG